MLAEVVFARFALAVASGGGEGICHGRFRSIGKSARRFDEVEDGDFWGD
jgi:hypothetical protein